MTVFGSLLVGAIAAVFLVAVYVIVRWSRKVDAVFPEAARKYGVSFTREKRGGFLRNVLDSSRLTGVVNGTPLEVVSTYQTRGRMRMRSTLVASPAPGLPPCTINISHRRPAADVHLVPTGDPQFDGQRWVTSDAPTAVRVLLTPAVRTALLRCPQQELRLVVDRGHFALSFGDTPSNQAELQGPVDAVLALARRDAP
jgi:hypothetical protein